MEFLMYGTMVLLGLTILGAFLLLFFVIGYIYKEIKKDNTVQEPVKYCHWREQDSGLLRTGCGEDFYDASESGNPATDWLNYCPYCGSKVEGK